MSQIDLKIISIGLEYLKGYHCMLINDNYKMKKVQMNIENTIMIIIIHFRRN